MPQKDLSSMSYADKVPGGQASVSKVAGARGSEAKVKLDTVTVASWKYMELGTRRSVWDRATGRVPPTVLVCIAEEGRIDAAGARCFISLPNIHLLMISSLSASDRYLPCGRGSQPVAIVPGVGLIEFSQTTCCHSHSDTGTRRY